MNLEDMKILEEEFECLRHKLKVSWDHSDGLDKDDLLLSILNKLIGEVRHDYI